MMFNQLKKLNITIDEVIYKRLREEYTKIIKEKPNVDARNLEPDFIAAADRIAKEPRKTASSPFGPPAVTTNEIKQRFGKHLKNL